VNRDDWDLKVSTMLWAYKTTCKKFTGHTPFRLVYGLPMDREKPYKYLEDKTKAKAISEEIKAKHDIERGNRGIMISDINDPTTRFSTRMLGCKLMHTCRKEEVPTRVVAAAA
jgi:hypothetical protein